MLEACISSEVTKRAGARHMLGNKTLSLQAALNNVTARASESSMPAAWLWPLDRQRPHLLLAEQ